jgi:hypothetical protein
VKPEVDVVLRTMMTKLLLEVAPAVGDAYVRSNVEAMVALLAAAAEEFDRAAEVRVAENRSMRAIFQAASAHVSDGELRARLALAACESDTSLRISDLNASNDRLRALLIELQALVEGRDEEWARQIDAAIWAELRASARRRAISFYPF